MSNPERLVEAANAFLQISNDSNPFDEIIQQAQTAEQRGDVTGLDEAINLREQILQHPKFVETDKDFQLAVLNNNAGIY